MHEGHRDRLRNKYKAAGIEAFHDHEILELLLFYCIQRKDTNPIAHSLLDAFGSLSGVLYADRKALEGVSGVGEGAALFISILGDAMRRAELSKRARTPLRTKGELSDYCSALLRGASEERFYALFLDARYNLISCRRLSVGTPDEVTVYPRAVAEAALRSSAVHVVIAHNHPAGNSNPSVDDIVTTRKIASALEPLGIDLQEHVIVTDEDCHMVTVGRKYGKSLENAAQKTGPEAVSKSDIDASELENLMRKLDKR